MQLVSFVLFCIVVSLENVITDIAEMEKGMEMTKREYEARKERDPPVILKDFLANSEDKIRKLRADAKSAQVNDIKNCLHLQWIMVFFIRSLKLFYSSWHTAVELGQKVE